MSNKRSTLSLVCFTLIPLLLAFRVQAEEIKILPPRADWPIAFPVVYEDAPQPPNAALLPDKPSYIPTLPGFISNKVMVNDYGKKVPKYDGVIIKGSKATSDRLLVPPGGLAYIDDTWRGLLPMLGDKIDYLGREYYFVDFVQTIRVKKDVELEIGKKVIVGDHFFYYYSAPGHTAVAANPTVMSGTIHGVDWAWAGLSPAVFSFNEPQWFGKRFNLGYNQGEAKAVTLQKISFKFIAATHFDSVTVANKRDFIGYVETGKAVRAGNYDIKVTRVDEAEGTMVVQILKDGAVKAEKTLGPVIGPERLPEDSKSRENLIIRHDNVAVHAIPWPKVVKDGKAQVAIYSGVFDLKSGQDWPFDKDYTYYAMACPIGHYFGAMIVNKKPIVLSKESNTAVGPEGYFKVVLDRLENGKVLKWHVEDKGGNRSVALGGKDKTNIDLILGKGRAVAGLLNYVGRETLETMYDYLSEQKAGEKMLK